MKIHPEQQESPIKHPQRQNYVDENYVIEEALPSGFWHRMDRRVEKAAEKFSNTKVGKVLKKGARGAGIIWNSKLMKPISWPVGKAAQGIGIALKHPVAQFGTFATGLTIAIIAVTAATPAGLPLAATVVALVAGGKIIKTFHEGRKHYRLAKLQEQIHLIKILKGMKEAQKEILEQFPPEVRQEIEERLIKKTQEQTIHHKQEMAKSQIVAENIASNLLSMASGMIDISQISSLSSIVDSMKEAPNGINMVLTHVDITELATMPIDEKAALTEVLTSENAARRLINELSKELEIPHAKKTSELRNFVAHVVADTLALQEITASPDITKFLEERQRIIDSSEHHNELPKQQSPILQKLKSAGKGTASKSLQIEVPHTPAVKRRGSGVSNNTNI